MHFIGFFENIFQKNALKHDYIMFSQTKTTQFTKETTKKKKKNNAANHFFTNKTKENNNLKPLFQNNKTRKRK